MSTVNNHKDALANVAHAWKENPQMGYVWLPTAQRAVVATYNDAIEDVLSMLNSIPHGAMANDPSTGDIGDDDFGLSEVEINVGVDKETLIKRLKLMKHGNY